MSEHNVSPQSSPVLHDPNEADCPANSLDPLLQHHAESFCQCALISRVLRRGVGAEQGAGDAEAILREWEKTLDPSQVEQVLGSIRQVHAYEQQLIALIKSVAPTTTPEPLKAGDRAKVKPLDYLSDRYRDQVGTLKAPMQYAPEHWRLVLDDGTELPLWLHEVERVPTTPNKKEDGK